MNTPSIAAAAEPAASSNDGDYPSRPHAILSYLGIRAGAHFYPASHEILEARP